MLASLAIVARAMALPLAGIPEPVFTDETSLLLQAQTYAAGHLVGRPALSPDFEAIYVFLSPVYASMYPVLRALPLAVADWLGVNPWFGVWASMIALTMAVYWALKAWIRPSFALAAALIVIARWGLFSVLINSYLGVGFTALGGALVLGGYRRLIDRGALRDGLALGLGAFILMTTRPFEGALFVIPFALGAAISPFRPGAATVGGRLAAGAVAALFVVLGFGLTAVDNQAICGDWRRQPTTLYRDTIAQTPVYLFQPLKATAPSRYDVTRVFLSAEETEWREGQTPGGLPAIEAERLLNKWNVYVGFALTLPFFLGLAAPRRRLAPWLALGCLGAGLTVVTWGLPHYAAPGLATFLLIIMTGMERLRSWRPGGRPVGLAASRWLALAPIIGLLAPLGVGLAGRADGGFLNSAGINSACCILATRSIHGEIDHRLRQIGGRHIVVVDTGPAARKRAGTVRFNEVLVYNDADVAASPVIWINADPALNPATFRRYPGRTLWRLDWSPSGTPRLSPYAGPAR